MTPRGTELRELPAALTALATAQFGTISGVQTADFISDRQLRQAVRHGQLVHLWWNVYCLPGCEWEVQSQLAAADLALGQRAVACLDTAAALHGFDVARDLRLSPGRVHVMAPATHHSRSNALSLHRFKLLSPLVEIAGRPATSPSETAVRLAGRTTDAMHALGILDAALRSRSTTPADLLEVTNLARFRGVGKVREVLHLADSRPESQPESWTRFACIRFGLPAPVPQVWVTGADGRDYRLDLAWEEFKVGLEYDGEDFHTGDGSMGKDRRKWNAVSRAGWALYSLTNESFWSSGRDLVLRMVAEEIAHRQANGTDTPALLRAGVAS